MRITNHPILGPAQETDLVSITIDDKEIKAIKGEMIAAALLANNIRVHRFTSKRKEPRGIYCGIGQCTDCVMVVNGKPNVRTCITPVEEGMFIDTQYGYGRKGEANDY